jgi:hypothetical protein
MDFAGGAMRTKLSVRYTILALIFVWGGCATPPAEVAAVSSRNPQYDRVVKRVVVVLGNLGPLDRGAVRSRLAHHLKSNDVNALVLIDEPMVLPQGPIRHNEAAVRALRPHAVLHLHARHVMGSFHHNVQSTFVAFLMLPAGRKVWDASFTMRGVEQGESVLVAELMKKLVADRIIDKDAVVPDETPGARQI